MKRALFLISLSVGLLSLLSACTVNTPTGEAAPDFMLTTLDGRTFHLADQREKAVLVTFWATWCVPCKQEMPFLEQLSKQKADSLVIMAIDMHEDESVVRPYAQQYGLTFPLLMHPPDSVLLDFNVTNVPLSLLIGRGGSLLARMDGPITEQTVRTMIDPALAAAHS